MSKQQIATPITEQDVRAYENMVRAKPADDKAERIEALRTKTADARAGLSAYQRGKLVAWWTHFYGEPPASTVEPHEMVEKFLDPPVQWPRAWRKPYTIHETVEVPTPAEDGSIFMALSKRTRTFEPKTDAEINEALNKRFAGQNGLTVRVLKYRYFDGVRGQLLFLPGLKVTDPSVVQCLHIGEYEKVAEQLYNGAPALGRCPMPPDVRDDDPLYEYKLVGDGSGNLRLRATSEQKSRKLLPRTIDALLSLGGRHAAPPGCLAGKFDWTCTPLVRVFANHAGRYGGIEFYGGQVFEAHAFWALKYLADPAVELRHGEHPIKILGMLTHDPVYTSQEILTPLTEGWQLWNDEELVPYMTANPGAMTDHQDFPFPVGL